MTINNITIKDFRKKHGISQKELAVLLGISHRTIQNYEANGVIPKSKHAMIRELINTFDTQHQVKEPQKNYSIPKELSGDVVEDLRQQIYNLKDIIKDKEEIITLLKDKIKNQ